MRKIWTNEKLYDAKFKFDEKCIHLVNVIREYFKTNKKKPMIFGGVGLFLLTLILAISFSYANLTPVSSVEIFSQNANFENGDIGSWKVTKSAKWVEEDIANINFKIESNLGVGNISAPSDFIFVFEDSAKMGAVGEENINLLYQFCTTMLGSITQLNENNRVAVITFNSTYTILSGFTRSIDSNQLNFTFSGNTNYYQALNGVNELLSNYVKEDGKNCNVIFISAGSPNEETPNEIEYSKMLRKKYPFLKINSIAAFYPDNENKTPLYNISDSVSTLSSGLSEIDMNKVMLEAIGLNNYLNFVIEDTINSEYFEVIEASSSIGEVTIDKSLENDKVIWDLKDKYYSKTEEELDIKLKLKDDYKDTEELLMFQTNIQEKITSSIYNLEEIEITEEVTSSLTPVLSTNYAVIYDSNDPETCTVSGVPENQRHKPHTTVEISDATPTCSGYMFKGWKIVEDEVEKIGKDYFIMPSHNVTLKAEWSKISIKKSMNSRVVEEGTLYAMMATNSVPDNIASEFVTSPTGIDFTQTSSDTNGKGIYQMASTSRDDRPIYYYRGAVDNNNVKFANFCWKIVRTTDTGGVKLIYNGPPDDAGGCTNTIGDITTIGQSFFFNMAERADADLMGIGYMYGKNPPIALSTSNVKLGSWYEFLGYSSIQQNINGKYYVSDDVSYDETTDMYTLINPKKKEFSYYLNNSNGVTSSRGYMCLDFETNSSTTCRYIILVHGYRYYNEYYVIPFTSGGKLAVAYSEIASWLDNQKIKFGKNVEYSDGTYRLTGDIYEITLASLSHSNLSTDIQKVYPYTCFNDTGVCTEINAFDGTGSYYVFSQGILYENYLQSLIDYATINSPNDNDSAIKKVIDSWYSSNLSDYTNYLEDTIWCNDRSVYKYGPLPEIGLVEDIYQFKFIDRFMNGSGPRLNCSLVDSFSVDPLYDNSNYNIQVGNGKLTYPIATLTADEVLLAGEAMTQNTTGYLYNGVQWNLLTPAFYAQIPFNTVINNGVISYLNIQSLSDLPYVRPSVSLKPGTKSSYGDGTPTSPFVIE